MLLRIGWLTALMVVCLAGWSKAADLNMEKTGVFSVDGISFYLQHFGAGWSSHAEQKTARADVGYPKSADQSHEFAGVWPLKGAESPVSIRQRIEPDGDGAFIVSYTVTSPVAIATESLNIGFDLSVHEAVGATIHVDDRDYVLPPVYKEMILFRRSNSSRIVIPARTGLLIFEGDKLNAYAQDNRKFNTQTFGFRLDMSTPGRQLTQATLTFKLRFKPYLSVPLNLSGPANMGFADPVADDHQGGWTDQGPGNDLSALKPGRLKALGVEFQVLDPAANNGRSCMVFAGPERDYFLKSASVNVSSQEIPANLYLLHATAWTPSGKVPAGIIKAVYTDGSEQSMEVVTGRDVDNFWGQSHVANGAIAWKGQNASASVCLYVSRFPLEHKPLEKLTFESTGRAVWMVVAASLSPDQIPLTAPVPEVITAGRDWAPFDNTADVAAGSALDFSSLGDAPAGKYGRLTVTPKGQFAFADRSEQSVRFYGANICFDTNFLDKPDADRLAERFARYGYNTVRLHHYDLGLQKKDGASYELDPAQLDKMDYLFAAFKKRGIYINIDLFTIREFPQAEVPDIDRVSFKALMPISDAAFSAWKKFAANLLTHKNPYTGLTWAEDPALIGICPVNEDSIFSFIGNPVVRQMYEVRFEQWLKTQPAVAEPDRGTVWNRFLTEIQADADRRQKDYLHSLGSKALVTGNNFWSVQTQAFIRERYDYVDNHGYWDHPSFLGAAWGLPFKFNQGNAVSASAALPRYLMSSRIVDKPFAVTEFNFLWPNAHRAQGGVLMAAYSSLQDWDALYPFDYGGLKPRQLTLFQLSTDPVNLLADRLTTLMYRRGDVAPAKKTIAFAVTEQTGYGRTSPTGFPANFSMLGLASRIGSFVWRPGQSEAVIPGGIDAIVADDPNMPKILAGKKVYQATEESLQHLLKDLGLSATRPQDGSIISDTGQIQIWPKEGMMKLVTERSECFILPPEASLEGKTVQVKNGPISGVVMVCAVDDKPLAESRRVVVAHLTDCLNTNQKFADQSRTLITHSGTLPVLIRRGSATINLKRVDDSLQAWALDNTGTRQWRIPMEKLPDGGLTLHVATVDQQGVSLAYELTR